MTDQTLDIRTITQGDLHPPIQMVLSDNGDEVDFSSVQLDSIQIVAEQGSGTLFIDSPDDKVVAQDGKSVTITRAWESGETDQVGRVYIRAWVIWPDDRKQTFPNDKPLYLDIRPAPATG